MIRVVVWKWDSGVHNKKNIKFTAEHVNRFFSMLSRNTTVQYEPVCITDDPKGIDEKIRIIPLWDDHRDLGGCYVRLKAFDKSMYDIIGPRFIWFDIDCVITGNVDKILNDPAEFKMWGDTNPRTPYNGSICLMDAGCRQIVWDKFHPEISPRTSKQLGYCGTDQAWIGAVLGKGEAKWGGFHDDAKQHGIYSYRCHIERDGKIDLPENARLVMFHGRHDPSHRYIQRKHPWVVQHWW